MTPLTTGLSLPVHGSFLWTHPGELRLGGFVIEPPNDCLTPGMY